MPLCRPPPNIIDPDHNDPAAHRYLLRSQHSLAITAPLGHTGIKPCYVDALYLLIAQEQANVVTDELPGQSLDLCELLQGPNKSIWRTSLANDLGQMTQGVVTRMPRRANTVFYDPKSRVPSNRKITYARDK